MQCIYVCGKRLDRLGLLLYPQCSVSFYVEGGRGGGEGGGGIDGRSGEGGGGNDGGRDVETWLK